MRIDAAGGLICVYAGVRIDGSNVVNICICCGVRIICGGCAYIEYIAGVQVVLHFRLLWKKVKVEKRPQWGVQLRKNRFHFPAPFYIYIYIHRIGYSYGV